MLGKKEVCYILRQKTLWVEFLKKPLVFLVFIPFPVFQAIEVRNKP